MRSFHFVSLHRARTAGFRHRTVCLPGLFSHPIHDGLLSAAPNVRHDGTLLQRTLIRQDSLAARDGLRFRLRLDLQHVLRETLQVLLWCRRRRLLWLLVHLQVLTVTFWLRP